jgi:hypothetical protein
MMVGKNLTTELSDDITKSEVGNHNNHHRNDSMFLVLVIAISLVTATMLSILTIMMMINAQASSFDDNNRGDSGTDKQMGICVVGVKSPCNGDSNNLAK